MKIYCLSGLGADKRFFQFLDLKKHELIHLEWIEAKPKETLKNYAIRIKEKIQTEEDFVLMGLSFGGMIATEIAKEIQPKLLILISSVPSKNEFPIHFKWAKWLKFHEISPLKIFKPLPIIANYFFSVKNQQDKKLLKEIIDQTDLKFLKWATGAILNWKNEKPVKCIRIHGTKDRILPLGKSKIKYPIKNGGHLIVSNKAQELSEIILKEIKKVKK